MQRNDNLVSEQKDGSEAQHGVYMVLEGGAGSLGPWLQASPSLRDIPDQLLGDGALSPEDNSL